MEVPISDSIFVTYCATCSSAKPRCRVSFSFFSSSEAASTGGTEWFVFRVTDVSAPAVDLASSEMKNLKDTLQRSLTEEQLTQYVAKLEKDIGTSVNEVAFAQVTGASGNEQ